MKAFYYLKVNGDTRDHASKMAEIITIFNEFKSELKVDDLPAHIQILKRNTHGKFVVLRAGCVRTPQVEPKS